MLNGRFSLSIRVQKTRQLFFSKTKYLPKAAEMGMQQKHQRWRRDCGGGGVAILRLRERLGTTRGHGCVVWRR